jgi:hypothetical protein
MKPIEITGIRNLAKMRHINDSEHTRTLFESVMMPEVVMALQDWIRGGAHGVLIGGTALSYHVRPRFTQNLDVLFLQSSDIPALISGFKRTRPSAFQHNKTHVEVEVVSASKPTSGSFWGRAPEGTNLPPEIANFVYQTAIPSNGLKVASESGIVAMKLFRLSLQDQADIVALIKTGRVNLDQVMRPADKRTAFDQLVSDAQTDPHLP